MMKDWLKIILVFFIFILIIQSIVGTFHDILLNRYFDFYWNYKSLKNKELYMVDDFVKIEHFSKDTNSDGSGGFDYIFFGKLLSNNSDVRITVYRKEYFNLNLDYQPVYRSKLTNDVFLKGAPDKYYNHHIVSIFMNFLTKVLFFILISTVIYHLIRHIKNRKYRI